MAVQDAVAPALGPSGVDRGALESWVREYVARALKAASPQLPIGYVVINDTGANPGVELGYGTWVAFSPGGTLYGFSAGVAPFDVAGASIGGLTHQHVYNDVPLHMHGLTLVNSLHLHANDISTANPSGSSGGSASIQGSNADPNSTKNTQNAATAVTGTADEEGVADPTTDAASSLAPGVVVYFWKRTA